MIMHSSKTLILTFSKFAAIKQIKLVNKSNAMDTTTYYESFNTILWMP